MRRRRRGTSRALAVAAALGGLGVAGPATAQCDLHIEVSDADHGQSLADVVVDPGASLGGSRRTDAHGSVTLRGRHDIVYEVRVARPGFETQRVEAICTSPEPRHVRVRLHPPREVSVLQLVADPQRWDGRPVKAVGFLHLDVAGQSALYLHREDLDHHITRNALALEPTEAMVLARGRLKDRYVVVGARFDAEDTGPDQRFGGSLDQIESCEPW